MSKAPLKEPILFNGLALIFILVLLPVSIALVADSAYTFEEENYQNAYVQYSGGTSNVAFIENGIDFSDSYDLRENFIGDEADCSYIVQQREPYNTGDRRYFQGSCEGDGVSGPTIGIGGTGINPDSLVKVQPSTALGKLAGSVPQTHHLIEPNLNHGYVGGSGTSNFSWAYMMNTTSLPDSWQLPNEQIGAFKIIKIDDQNTYSCTDKSFFDEIIFQYSLELWYDQELLLLEFEDIQVNYVTNVANPSQCYPSMTLFYNFTGMQIVEISNHNNNDWYNTTIISRINHIQRADGNNWGLTYLPFGGISEYTESFEYILIEDADVKQGLSNIALILGIGMGVIGLASTTYWNPVVDRFRRFKID